MNGPATLVFRKESGAGVRVDLATLIGSRLLVQANSGGGKSRMLRYLCEQLAGQVQIIVLDPEGEFATLRERFDFMLAGADGDVPATPKAAKLLARRLLELNASAIIDLYDLKLDDRRKYVRLFLEELMHLPRSLWRPLLVIIDEAHGFAPERGAGEAESTNAVITLCTQGRKRGFAAVLATQRISKLHKDAAAELLNKLIGRTGLDVDMRRAGDELGMDKDRRLTLRDLEPGTFYAFGPALGAGVQLVRGGPVVTTHPKPGEIAPPLPPAPAAIQRMLKQMQGLEHEAEEEARTIEDLQRQLAAARTQIRKLERAKPDAAPVTDDRAIARAVADAERRIRAEYDVQQRAQRTTERQLREQLAAQSKRTERIGKLASQIAELTGVIPEIEVGPPPAPRKPVVVPPEPRAPLNGKVTRPQQRILEVLVSLSSVGLDQPDRSTVAVFADQSPRSSGYSNNLGALRTAGLIDYPTGGCVSITDDGLMLVGEVPRIDSLEQLHEAWLSRVSGPQRRMLEQLIEIYPDPIARNDLAELTQQSASSSGFANNLGFLRNSLGLVDYPSGGMVVATKRLFPEELK